jgi:double-stranded RNA-binding protein Staufen
VCEPENLFNSSHSLIFQVSAAGQSAQGSGPNKKLAKRAAAEALLQIMGYSRPSLQPSKPALKTSISNGSTTSSSSSTMSTASVINGEVKPSSSPNSGGGSHKEKTKKLTFVDQVKAGDSRTNGTDDQQRAAQKNNIPGILYLDSNAKKESKLEGNGCKLINGYGKRSAVTMGVAGKCSIEEEDNKMIEPKEELQYLSEALGFQVTYTEFPQKNTSAAMKKSVPEFITLVNFSTKPPKVCHGKGSSREASQTDAARRALVLLADSGDNMSTENDDAVGSERSENDNASSSKAYRIENQTMETGDVSRRGATLNSRGGDSILNGSKKSIESSSIPIVSAAVVSTTANSAHIGSGTQSAKAAAKSAASCNDDKQE